MLADRVAVIVAGKIVAEGPPDNLAGDGSASEIRFTLPAGTGADALPELASPAKVLVEGASAPATAPDPTVPVPVPTGWAIGRGFTLPDLTVTRPRLEDVYLELTKEATGPAVAPESVPSRTRPPMSDLAIAARQVRYEQKAFWRNPAAAVFPLAAPPTPPSAA